VKVDVSSRLLVGVFYKRIWVSRFTCDEYGAVFAVHTEENRHNYELKQDRL